MYGPNYRAGVLAEHAGTDRFVGRSGRPFARDPHSGEVQPILCGEIVWIDTEDGRIDGRCGDRVIGADGFACPGHAEVIAGWRAESEVETIAWESRVERAG